MNGNVVSLPNRAPTLVTKKQLAKILGRSERWVELAVRDREMPVVEATDRFGRRRYNLAAVEAWMKDGVPKRRPASVERRLASLEAQMNELLRRTA